VPQWFQDLHAAVAAAGYRTRIVAADSGWDVADAMASDPTFNAAVDIVGAHYPCGGDGAPAYSCSTTQTALDLKTDRGAGRPRRSAL
jgi:hypothetical protein